MTAQPTDQPRSFLSRAFSYAKGIHPINKGLLVAAVAMHLVPESVVRSGIEFYRDQTAQKVSDLSAAESALVQSVFGADFATDTIRKRYSNNETACGETNSAETAFVACVRRGSDTITIATPNQFIDDYSQDGSLSGRRISTFMHEVTHIWQNRTNAPNGGRCSTYDLPPTDVMNAAMTFDQYCNERQGQLVGLYSAIYLRPTQVNETDLSTEHGRYFDRIRQIVEAKFPRAAQLRAHMQSRARAHLTCFNAAGSNQNAQSICNNRYYTNLRGQPLTASASQVTFTLPNGQVRYPALEEARRNGELPAARPTS